MSKIYNVLWIDDEHDDDALFPFILQAEQQGVMLHGYSSFKEGFNALEDSISYYDFILLDGLFFDDEKSETVGKKGLGSSIAKINELKSRKFFPHFVFSGQPSFTDEENDIIAANDIRCFNKKNLIEVKELLQAIKDESDKQIETQIKHENQALFNALAEYPDEARDTFISIFKGFKGLNHQFEDQLYFTQLRIILESLFRKANAIGLLHDKCVTVGGNKVNLTDSSLFLAGYDTKYLEVKSSVTHFPKLIAESVRNIIFTTGAASHTTEVDITQNINIQAYRKDIKTPYLLYSLALQLMDVLIWFDGYRKINSDVNYNKSLWQDLNSINTTINVASNNESDEEIWLEGDVINVHAEKGFAFLSPVEEFKNVFIPPYLVNDNALKEGMFIKGLIEEYKDAKTGDLLVKIKQVVILK